MMRKDIVIVGAGPAGSSCAYFLARLGHNVLLVDKRRFPREKVCGDAISPRSLKTLEEMKLLSTIERSGFKKSDGITIFSPSGYCVSAKSPKTDFLPYGYVAPRVKLDELLRNHAVDAGAEFLEVSVKEPLLKDKSVVGVKGKHDGDTIEINSETVVAANGAFSALARHLLGEKWKQRGGGIGVALRAYFSGVESFDFVEFHYERAVLPGYGWIFPVGDAMANVGVGVMFERGKMSLNACFKRFVSDAAKLKGAKQVSKAKGWLVPTGGGSRHRRAMAGILFVGDAASFVNPLTGEGISYALESGKLAADVIAKALRLEDTSMRTLEKYDDAWKERFAADFRYSLLLRRLIKRPLLLDRIIKNASEDEKLAELLCGVVTNVLPKRKAMTPIALLKFLL
ncbi:geranylgeranyl reductase family protein [Candidatus Alkanophaga liquidiphilum]